MTEVKVRVSSKKLADELSSLLVEAATVLNSEGLLSNVPALQTWWTNHNSKNEEKVAKKLKSVEDAHAKQLAKVQQAELKLKKLDQERELLRK